MNEERQKRVLSWLYSECGHKWFTPLVLDPVANKAGNPPENLKMTEIHSIFETLRKEEYIFPVVNQFGHSCFILNEMKELEWIDRIEDTAPTKSRIVGKYAKTGILYFSRELGAGVVGGVVAIITGKLLGIL